MHGGKSIVQAMIIHQLIMFMHKSQEMLVRRGISCTNCPKNSLSVGKVYIEETALVLDVTPCSHAGPDHQLGGENRVKLG